MTDAELKLVHMIEVVCLAFRKLPEGRGHDAFHRHAEAMQDIVHANASRREMVVTDETRARWEGWTDLGEKWLADGCPGVAAAKEPQA